MRHFGEFKAQILIGIAFSLLVAQVTSAGTQPDAAKLPVTENRPLDLTLIPQMNEFASLYPDVNLDNGIAKLLNQLENVFVHLNAPLKLSENDRKLLTRNARTLKDPQTQQPYKTAKGQTLIHYVFGKSVLACSHEMDRKTVLVIGGIHGDEAAAIYSSWRALIEMLNRPNLTPENTQVIYAPLTNPDGFFHTTGKFINPIRRNGRNVDINRDFSSSRPQIETNFIKTLIAKYHPTHIVSVHAPFAMLDYDGPEEENRANEWFQLVKKVAPELSTNRDLGSYPGSLGSYAGKKMKIPTLTIEFPAAYSKDSENQWKLLGASIFESLKVNQLGKKRAAPVPKTNVPQFIPGAPQATPETGSIDLPPSVKFF